MRATPYWCVFRRRSGVQLVQPLADDGLIEIRPGGFDVTILGRLFLRNIAMCFDAYLPAASAVTSAAPAKPMFSQTI